jgi:hypothetical protein
VAHEAGYPTTSAELGFPAASNRMAHDVNALGAYAMMTLIAWLEFSPTEVVRSRLQFSLQNACALLTYRPMAVCRFSPVFLDTPQAPGHAEPQEVNKDG